MSSFKVFISASSWFLASFPYRDHRALALSSKSRFSEESPRERLTFGTSFPDWLFIPSPSTTGRFTETHTDTRYVPVPEFYSCCVCAGIWGHATSSPSSRRAISTSRKKKREIANLLSGPFSKSLSISGLALLSITIAILMCVRAGTEKQNDRLILIPSHIPGRARQEARTCHYGKFHQQSSGNRPAYLQPSSFNLEA